MKKKDVFLENLIESVKADFLTRQKERKRFEAQWRLNELFFEGKQYAHINTLKDIELQDKAYFWQAREVFNHVAPIVETRLAKLTAVRPEMEVLPASNNEKDVKVASLSQAILRGVYEKLDIAKTISKATNWSELTGTSFYKIAWNANKGKKVYGKGKEVYEGEVEVTALPPYEIYPDSPAHENIADCESIIHAKAYSINAIKNIWGVDVVGRDINA